MTETCKGPSFKSVMLVDDSEIDNFINKKVLENNCFTKNVFVHSSCMSAIEFLSNLHNLENAPPELIPSHIFLDINMPILDGYHFLEEFKKLPIVFKSNIKVVMLTSSINPADEQRAKLYDEVVDFLRKPLQEEELSKLK